MKKGWLNWITITGVSLVSFGIVLILLLQPYRPEEPALESLQSDKNVIVENRDDSVVFYPTSRAERGFIFYPGGLVDHRAYAPLMRALAENGLKVFLVEMPFDLAVLSPERAGAIIRENREIKTWIIAGHSLGGSMAARFAQNNRDLVRGLVLLAAYPPEGDDLSNSRIKVLSLYGSLDGVLNFEALENSKFLLPANTKWLTIEGGNHAQFGYYGHQKGDLRATISPQEQQKITLTAILSFIDSLNL